MEGRNLNQNPFGAVRVFFPNWFKGIFFQIGLEALFLIRSIKMACVSFICEKHVTKKARVSSNFVTRDINSI
jgi:hypothetical protein